MAEIVNLRQARKQRARREAEDAAGANRAKHGRTRAEREAEARREAERRRLLDSARLDPTKG
jgi:predicted nucleic acid-binding protein